MEFFVVKVKSPMDEEMFRYLLKFVQPEKQERILKQRLKQDADNKLVGEILAKAVIKKTFGIDIKKQKFACTEYGKPYLNNFPDIHFNISHSGEYVVCGVSDKPIGIDIQKISEYNERVAKRVLNEKELMQIEKSDDKAIEFTKLWAMKEAVLKRNGKGFSDKDVKNCLENESLELERINDYFVAVAT